MNEEKDNIYQCFYENLASSYEKMLHSIIKTYKKLEKESTIIFIIAIASLLLNIVFLAGICGLSTTNDKLNKKLIKEHKKNVKLKSENDALWDNYYMNVNNYEGYEYYE